MMNHEPFDLTGKVAFVTGGASGLGRRMAQTLAAAGAAVGVADINGAQAEQVAAALRGEGRLATAVQLDVTDPESVRQAVEQLATTYDGLHIGVNAAGIAGGRPEDDTMVAVWRRIIDVDLNGVYYCCLAYRDIMQPQGVGSIINIASMSATIVNHFPQPPVDEARILALQAYCAAKAGVRQLTRALGAQWAADKIRVNCISPGYMHTEMTEGIFEMPEVIGQIRAETPLGRVGKPEDLDGAILYLASDASAFMTGGELLIDGGYTLW